MITFKQFIMEADNEDLPTFIREHCQQAMKDALEAGACLWRGKKNPSGKHQQFQYEHRVIDGFISTPRKDRNPSDMPAWAHKVVDDTFKDMFGIRLRSESVFAHARRSRGYGEPYVMLPMGKYKIYWSPRIDDLTTTLFPDFSDREYTGVAGGLDHWNERDISEANISREIEIEFIKDTVENADYTNDSNVKALSDPKRQIWERMVVCEKYLLLPGFGDWDEVHDLLIRAQKDKS